MTLRIGEIWRTPYHLVDGHQIDALSTSSTFSKKLNTAIKTIKYFKEEIIAFSRGLSKYLELPKRVNQNCIEHIQND